MGRVCERTLDTADEEAISGVLLSTPRVMHNGVMHKHHGSELGVKFYIKKFFASFGSSKLEIEPELAARIYIARENDEKSKKFLGRGGNCFINIFFPRYLMPLLQPSSNSRRAISRLHQCAGAAHSTTLIYYIGIQTSRSRLQQFL